MNKIVDAKIYIKNILSNIFPNNIIDQIIIKTITDYEIKNFIGEEIIKYTENNYCDLWSWNQLSQNPNITLDIIDKYPNKPWNLKFVIQNPNMTLEYIEKNIDKPWDWYFISNYKNLTLDFVIKYIHKPWNYGMMMCNVNLTEKLIENAQICEQFDKQINWYNISSLGKITIELFEKYADSDKYWHYEMLSRNSNFMIEFTNKAPDKPWNWGWISAHKNVTMEIIKTYPNKHGS